MLVLLTERAVGETSYHMRYTQNNKLVRDVESSASRLSDFLAASEIENLVIHLKSNSTNQLNPIPYRIETTNLIYYIWPAFLSERNDNKCYDKNNKVIMHRRGPYSVPNNDALDILTKILSSLKGGSDEIYRVYFDGPVIPKVCYNHSNVLIKRETFLHYLQKLAALRNVDLILSIGGDFSKKDRSELIILPGITPKTEAKYLNSGNFSKHLIQENVSLISKNINSYIQELIYLKNKTGRRPVVWIRPKNLGFEAIFFTVLTELLGADASVNLYEKEIEKDLSSYAVKVRQFRDQVDYRLAQASEATGFEVCNFNLVSIQFKNNAVPKIDASMDRLDYKFICKPNGVLEIEMTLG